MFSYVEMAILKSYEFIQHNTFPIVINRISQMIRGVGDPLIATYVRTYLARQGYMVAPTLKDYVINSFYDSLFSTQQMFKSPKFEQELKSLHITLSEYLHLYSPALEWQLQCVGHNASLVTMSRISY